ncbi:hypothetical protein BST61_g8190 [Cercospora zeina]
MSDVKQPNAFTSVQAQGGRSLILYVDEEKTIHGWLQKTKNAERYYKDPPSSVDEKKHYLYNRVPYQESEVVLDTGKIIKTASADLAVVTLISGGPKKYYQIRVYYADENQVLSELCMDLDPTSFKPVDLSAKGESEDGNWYKGKLGEHGIKVEKGTAISAHVTKKEGQDHTIKVYHFAANPNTGKGFGQNGRPSLAWITLDYADGWLTTNSGV